MAPRTSMLLLVPLAGLPALADRGGGELSRVPVTKILSAARDIDRLIEKDLEGRGVRPNPMIGDWTFVRRAYLQIAGRIPTGAEAKGFARSRHSTKRRKLVDALLSSRGHESHMFHWWADLLRVKSRLQGRLSGEPYVHWVKQSIADNKPYDRMVRELLAASGPAHARGNGATGYYLRDRGMPEDNMSNTVRVFLGTRLECAQCHDHPFDKWKQKEFFQMAAFTGGIGYRENSYMRGETGERLRDLGEMLAMVHGREGQRALQRILQPLQQGVTGSGAGLARLPHDYQYDDARPNQPIKADTMFGDDVEIDVAVPDEPRRRQRNRRPNRRQRNNFPGIGSREDYAAWMTSPRNPRFTAVIANRMWKRAFGRGLIEPADDMKDDTVPVNPELMRYLEQLMVDLGYDLRQFQRVLFNTRCWQREATGEDVPADAEYAFPGPLLQRMSAEQMWDSLLTLVVDGVDEKLAAPGAGAEPVYAQYEALLEVPAGDLIRQAEAYVLRRTKPEEYRKMVAKQRREQQQRRSAERRTQQEAMRKRARRIQGLVRELQKARRRKDTQEVARLSEQLKEIGYDPQRRRQRRPARRAGGQSARASDLPSPARPGHLLRQFGQSDREQIEAGNKEASVPQVLTLLNGFVDQQVLRPGSAIANVLDEAPDARAKLRAAFLAILSREPSRAEEAMWLDDDMTSKTDETFQDLVWTLVNTHEFRFVQ